MKKILTSTPPLKKYNRKNHFKYTFIGEITKSCDVINNIPGEIKYRDKKVFKTIAFSASNERVFQVKTMVCFMNAILNGNPTAVNIFEIETNNFRINKLYLLAPDGIETPNGGGTVTDEKPPFPKTNNFYVLRHSSSQQSPPLIEVINLPQLPTIQTKFISYDVNLITNTYTYLDIVGLWSNEN